MFTEADVAQLFSSTAKDLQRAAIALDDIASKLSSRSVTSSTNALLAASPSSSSSDSLDGSLVGIAEVEQFLDAVESLSSQLPAAFKKHAKKPALFVSNSLLKTLAAVKASVPAAFSGQHAVDNSRILRRLFLSSLKREALCAGNAPIGQFLLDASGWLNEEDADALVQSIAAHCSSPAPGEATLPDSLVRYSALRHVRVFQQCALQPFLARVGKIKAALLEGDDVATGELVKEIASDLNSLTRALACVGAAASEPYLGSSSGSESSSRLLLRLLRCDVWDRAIAAMSADFLAGGAVSVRRGTAADLHDAFYAPLRSALSGLCGDDSNNESAATQATCTGLYRVLQLIEKLAKIEATARSGRSAEVRRAGEAMKQSGAVLTATLVAALAEDRGFLMEATARKSADGHALFQLSGASDEAAAQLLLYVERGVIFVRGAAQSRFEPCASVDELFARLS